MPLMDLSLLFLFLISIFFIIWNNTKKYLINKKGGCFFEKGGVFLNLNNYYLS